LLKSFQLCRELVMSPKNQSRIFLATSNLFIMVSQVNILSQKVNEASLRTVTKVMWRLLLRSG